MAWVGRTRDYLLHMGASEETLGFARRLRHRMTDSERMLWNEIRCRKLMGLKFRRQHPLRWYIADFYCHELRLVIEVDGEIHDRPDIQEHDDNRTGELDRFGITVLRFTNSQIADHMDKVLEQIKNTILSLKKK